MDRVESRYLEHIRALIKRKTSGFVVLALDCALIETLEQFRRGKARTPPRDCRKYFEAFLTETAFAKHFNTNLAINFYTEIDVAYCISPKPVVSPGSSEGILPTGQRDV